MAIQEVFGTAGAPGAAPVEMELSGGEAPG